jgi:uncharacterized damage-inducible protein DinB
MPSSLPQVGVPAITGEVPRIIDQIERAFGGDAWHGPSVVEALDGLTAGDAARRPIADAHTAWEIVCHLTSWKHEVRRRLEGAAPAVPLEGDWPEPGAPTEEAWDRARDGLRTAHRRLVAAARQLRDERLRDLVGAHRDAPLGTGVSFYALLLGIAQHDAYHAGQIAVLRKASSE